MNYTFNELSLEIAAEIDTNGVTLLEILADVCSVLFNQGFRSIKMADRRHFLAYELQPGLPIASLLKKTSGLTDRQRYLFQKLKSIITSSSGFWDEQLQAAIDGCPLVFIDHGGRQVQPEGLKIACILKTICVSLCLNESWDKSELEAIWVEQNDQTLHEQKVPIRHASNVEHLLQHTGWFKALLRQGKLFTDWKPSLEYLPNLDFSNELVTQGDWNHYYKERDSAKSAEERLGVILKYGREVAKRNSYIHNSELSNRNSTVEKKRVIFQAGDGRHRIYLSIDMEKGGFEICDYTGNHLGEYFYDGSFRQGPEKDHSITIF